MKINQLLFILTSVFAFSNNTVAQETLSDADHIKTIVVKPHVTNYYMPIIRMDEILSINFDDLNADMQDYTYQITHCNQDWQPSNLSETEFIVGYASDRIRDFESSFNTLQAYVNYNFTLPNQNTRFKISGNYLVSVLNEDEEIVFTRKFILYQDNVTVGVTTLRSRNILTRNEQQTVQFSINHPNLRLNNPSQEINVVVLQNGDWKTSITNLKPQFIRRDQLLYKYDRESSFESGNEFLFFDTKDIRNAGVNIHSIKLVDELYHTYLYTDEERGENSYSSTQDVNGNFVIRILNGEDSNIDADYSWVSFSLAASKENKTKEIYINGNFNNWELNKNNKMTFNPKTNTFEAQILLKQGFYNYEYVVLNKDNSIDKKAIDGSFFQTENEYTVIVYYKKPGARYTSIIGVGRTNSLNITN